MAITTTLSRLKNYFIGWHTANYRTLHEFTDQITEDEPDGSKLVESKTIFRYINDLITPIKEKVDDLDDNIGIRCIPRHGETLWENICGLWSTIGEWASPNDPDLESFWNLNRTDNSDWNPVWENGVLTDNWPKGWTVKGWIRKIWYEILKVQSPRISSLETSVQNLWTYASQWYRIETVGNIGHGYHHLVFERRGQVVFVSGTINPTMSNSGTLYHKFMISGTSDKWRPVIPIDDAKLSYNHAYASAVSTEYAGDHTHQTQGWTKNASASGLPKHKHEITSLDEDKYVEHYHKVQGINTVEISMSGSFLTEAQENLRKEGSNDTVIMTVTVTGYQLSSSTGIYVSGFYLARDININQSHNNWYRSSYSWGDNSSQVWIPK